MIILFGAILSIVLQLKTQGNAMPRDIKNIQVSKSTHAEFKIASAKKDKKFDEFVLILLADHEKMENMRKGL